LGLKGFVVVVVVVVVSDKKLLFSTGENQLDRFEIMLQFP